MAKLTFLHCLIESGIGFTPSSLHNACQSSNFVLLSVTEVLIEFGNEESRSFSSITITIPVPPLKSGQSLEFLVQGTTWVWLETREAVEVGESKG